MGINKNKTKSTKSIDFNKVPERLPKNTVINVDGIDVEDTGKYLCRTLKLGNPHLIGPRNYIPDANAAVPSLTRAYCIYKPISVNRNISGLELIFTNWFLVQNGIETDNTSTVTIKVGIHIPNTTDIIPVFVNGNRTITLAPGATIKTDRIPINIDPIKISGINIRLWISVPSATDKLCTSSHLTTYESTNTKSYRIDGATNTFVDDLSYSKAQAYYGAYEFGPAAVLGYADDGSQIPSVAIIGSSSAQGVGDVINVQNPQFVLGYIARSLKEKNIPYINISMSGETGLNFLTDGAGKRRNLLNMCNCTYAINTYGSNDISTGATYDQMIIRLQKLNQVLSGFGFINFFATYTPATTSTDAWATVANQTVGSVVRPQLNTWLLTSSGFNIIDLEKYIDSGRSNNQQSTGKWRTDIGVPTTDGIHGSPIAHYTLQQGIVDSNILDLIKF